MSASTDDWSRISASRSVRRAASRALSFRCSTANRDQPSSRFSSLTIRSSWPSDSRIWRSRASLSWKSRSSAKRTSRRCSSFARSSRTSVSALFNWASLSILCVSRICSRISSSRENLRARRSREAFSGSRPRRASESRNIRSSSSVIWAAAFSWVKPIASRSAADAALAASAGLASVFALSSSKTPAALAASAGLGFWASGEPARQQDRDQGQDLDGPSGAAEVIFTRTTCPGPGWDPRHASGTCSRACHRRPPACAIPGPSRWP